MYLLDCRQRNLREGTIRHYRQSFLRFSRFFDDEVHRYRHTFAKQWVLNGGNVVTLSRLLGHSSLDITQKYMNLLVTDMGKQVEEINLLDKFAAKKRISLK